MCKSLASWLSYLMSYDLDMKPFDAMGGFVDDPAEGVRVLAEDWFEDTSEISLGIVRWKIGRIVGRQPQITAVFTSMQLQTPRP